MQMQHHFTVPAPIDVAWSALLDPGQVAPCMPGATLTQAEGDEFAGSVKVKLGPISLLYKGTGAFSTVDADARRVVIDASGKDARGNGTAAASVTAVLTEETGSAEPGTFVQVDTDLKITGKPAQLGRGLISEVGGKILDQFAACLSERLAGAAGAESAAETESAAEAEQAAEAGSTVGADTGGERAAGESGAGSGAGESAGADGQRPARNGEPSGTSAAPVGKAPGWRVTPPSAAEADAAGRPGAPPGDQSTDGAIDLLETAGAPVSKRVVPVLVAIAAVGIAVFAIRRKRRR